MDQLLKLNKELSEGKKEVDGIKNNIKDLEQELKAQELMMQSHAPKLVVSWKTCYFRLHKENDIDQVAKILHKNNDSVTQLSKQHEHLNIH